MKQMLIVPMKKKKGAVVETLRVVGAVILTLLTIAVIAIAVFLALTSLQNAGIFTANSQAANQTTNIVNNITTGTTNFFAQIPTIMTVLGVVALIAAVILIIFYVSRMGGSQSGL